MLKILELMSSVADGRLLGSRLSNWSANSKNHKYIFRKTDIFRNDRSTITAIWGLFFMNRLSGPPLSLRPHNLQHFPFEITFCKQKLWLSQNLLERKGAFTYYVSRRGGGGVGTGWRKDDLGRGEGVWDRQNPAYVICECSLSRSRKRHQRDLEINSVFVWSGFSVQFRFLKHAFKNKHSNKIML